MAMSAEQRSKFAAHHRWWWRLHMSEKFSSVTINPEQTNKHFTSVVFRYDLQYRIGNVFEYDSVHVQTYFTRQFYLTLYVQSN